MQLHSKKLDVKSYLNNQLSWFDNNIGEIKKPKILIAGCGTGETCHSNSKYCKRK